MKPKKPTRHADGSPLTKAEIKRMSSFDGLQLWISQTLVRAIGLKANEIRYERAKAGLTVQFLKGTEVLKAVGPYKRYQDRAIPRLQKMGVQGLPKKYQGETGRFFTVVDGREWNTPIFYTKTNSGERMVVRFTTSKPYAGK